jgi:hypothetical protein
MPQRRSFGLTNLVHGSQVLSRFMFIPNGKSEPKVSTSNTLSGFDGEGVPYTSPANLLRPACPARWYDLKSTLDIP